MAYPEASDHDWGKQYRETAWVFEDLQGKGVDFSRHYRLDLQFVPGPADFDWDEFVKALRSVGYDIRFYKDGSTVEATTTPMLLTVESIWSHEKQATEIALRYGFRPDGWGFLED